MEMGSRAGPFVETVALFASATELQDAIDDLLSSGFDRADLSVLSDEKSVEKKLGHRYGTVRELEDDDAVPRSTFVALESIGDAEGALVAVPLYVGAIAAAGLILAYGGKLVTAITGAIVAGAAGGLIGVIFAKLIAKHHAHYLGEQLDHGGLLLWVRTPDVRHIKRAVEILFAHSGRDVHVHALPAAG